MYIHMYVHIIHVHIHRNRSYCHALCFTLHSSQYLHSSYLSVNMHALYIHFEDAYSLVLEDLVYFELLFAL